MKTKEGCKSNQSIFMTDCGKQSVMKKNLPPVRKQSVFQEKTGAKAVRQLRSRATRRTEPGYLRSSVAARTNRRGRGLRYLATY